jgi:hypothetical protein
VAVNVYMRLLVAAVAAVLLGEIERVTCVVRPCRAHGVRGRNPRHLTD